MVRLVEAIGAGKDNTKFIRTKNSPKQISCTTVPYAGTSFPMRRSRGKLRHNSFGKIWHSKFRPTTNLGTVNAAKKPEKLPTPITREGLSHLTGRKLRFSELLGAGGHWHVLFTQTLMMSVESSARKVFLYQRELLWPEECFGLFLVHNTASLLKCKKSIKAWIDDFILHSRSWKDLFNDWKHFWNFWRTQSCSVRKKCNFYEHKVK